MSPREVYRLHFALQDVESVVSFDSLEHSKPLAREFASGSASRLEASLEREGNGYWV